MGSTHYNTNARTNEQLPHVVTTAAPITHSLLDFEHVSLPPLSPLADRSNRAPVEEPANRRRRRGGPLPSSNLIGRRSSRRRRRRRPRKQCRPLHSKGPSALSDRPPVHRANHRMRHNYFLTYELRKVGKYQSEEWNCSF